MKYLYLPPLLFCLLIGSCRKKENPPQPEQKPKVQVQTEYRLQRVYGDSGTIAEFHYNVDNLVVKEKHAQLNYYSIPYVGAYVYYKYDDANRIIKSAENENVIKYDYSDNYMTYSYNSNMLPESRYSVRNKHAVTEYVYDGKRLKTLKHYDDNGDLIYTDEWAYNGSDNASSYTREFNGPHDQPQKTIVNILSYDKSNAISLALPGIQDVHLTTSVNNPTLIETTLYSKKDGTGVIASWTASYTYEYNSGKFPVKQVSKVTKHGQSSIITQRYFEYNK